MICQLGGQTPLGLARGLEDAEVPIVGTTPEAIHLAEERGAFGRVLAAAGLPAPKRHRHVMRRGPPDRRGDRLPGAGRPSYVLGGRGVEIVYDDDALRAYLEKYSGGLIDSEHPVLVDQFLDDAVEIDVDALYDGEELFLGGVMEHIEEASIPLRRLELRAAADHPGPRDDREDPEVDRGDRQGCRVRGLLNVQYAMASDVVYVLEANPRASRTVPFVSKATATPLAKAAAVMLGESIANLRAEELLPAESDGGDYAAGRADRGQGGGDAVQPVQDARRPHRGHHPRPGDALTGEVMGFDAFFGTAFAKAQTAAFGPLPTEARCSSRSPTSTSGTWSSRSSGSRTSATRSSRRRAPPRCSAATASTPPWCASTEEPRSRTASRRSSSGSSTAR